jgi:hypothetical protein
MNFQGTGLQISGHFTLEVLIRRLHLSLLLTNSALNAQPNKQAQYHNQLYIMQLV